MAHIKPIASGGLSADDLLRKAMQTRPPKHDPKPPKAVRRKPEKGSKKKKTSKRSGTSVHPTGSG